MKNEIEFIKYFHYRHPADYIFTGHRHTRNEINILLDGEMEITCDDKIITLKKNNILVFGSNVFHHTRIISKKATEMLVIEFNCDDYFTQAGTVFSVDDYERNLISLIIFECENEKAFEIEHGICNNKSNTRIQMLLFLLITRLKEKNSTISLKKDKNASLYYEAVNYMKNNLSKKITVDEIAKVCKVSPTKIKNVFSECTGCGVIQHFINLKISEATILLSKGIPVGTVSDMLGFSSQAYFSLCFKKFLGNPPIKYKAST